VDEEVDVERLVLAERVEPCRGQVRAQCHVRLVDGLETTDRRSVERQGLIRVERLGRDREVLHHAGQVAKTNVYELDVVVGDVPRHLFGVVEHQSSSTRRQARAIVFAGSGLLPGGHWPRR
jgi:predicted RecB family nuclease